MSKARSQVGSMERRFSFRALIMTICFCLWGTYAAAAESPQAVIQEGTDQVLNLLKQYPQNDPARGEHIKAAMEKYFDFESMARLAVGRQWDSLSQEQRQRFTQEFRDLLFSTYLGDIEKYASEKMNYRTRPLTEGYVIVNTQLNYQGNPVSLDYFLHQRDAHWKVYDVSIQGVSLVVNYRGQFDTVLLNGSFNDLSTMVRRETAKTCRLNGNC